MRGRLADITVISWRYLVQAAQTESGVDRQTIVIYAVRPLHGRYPDLAPGGKIHRDTAEAAVPPSFRPITSRILDGGSTYGGFLRQR